MKLDYITVLKHIKPPQPSATTVWWMLAAVVGAFLIFVLFEIVARYLRRRRRTRRSETDFNQLALVCGLTLEEIKMLRHLIGVCGIRYPDRLFTSFELFNRCLEEKGPPASGSSPPVPPPPPPPPPAAAAQVPYPQQYPYPYPYPYPSYHPYWYPKHKIFKRMSEMPIILIFLICITVFWLPYILSNFLAFPFLWLDEGMLEVIIGVGLCIITLGLMFFIRKNLDNPSWKDYGLTTKNLGSNLFLGIKLIFIIYAIESLVILFFRYIGVSFEGGVSDINILFIISAVIIAPIFEETVYRMNASTLLARRLPIVWVAIITSTWFIVKHVPMWHLDNGFGLPAISIIIAVDVPLWIIVTYYFLKRNCIWIPVMVHVFNNGSIALFHYLPEREGILLDYIFLGIGIIFVIGFAIPKIYRVIKFQIIAGKIKITDKSYFNLVISLGLIFLFLITSEGLVFLAEVNPLACASIGIGLFLISLATVGYILANRDTIYAVSEPETIPS